ncbi:PspA/IM30 family protein [Dethiosulfatarculus sandiegensis]|uniref:Phage-shock protein n=1 Tax=Dethiosulfatarculus sandiegensis TaxID=1429043 RepID=A0A0D2HV06_9BACT|nr:PspA/IM30 family protein [Dethiosulfatarculus sandiegensis]KIX14253.1 phage-shock protein [Dethiosulfatarculus sandiegensis]
MSFFKRLFSVAKSEAHAAVDKLEDPVKMTEQGIRDLKNDLRQAMTSLAEVKAIAIRTRRNADNKKKLAADYERKAMSLLQQMQSGSLDAADAERLATEALNLKEQNAGQALTLAQEAEHHEKMSAQLQAQVNKIKSTITSYENDLTTLKARATTAQATQKINKQMSQIDPSDTISMLEKMKARVEESESLAVAYGELADVDTNVDQEINAALSKGAVKNASSNLDELKKKMGIS